MSSGSRTFTAPWPPQTPSPSASSSSLKRRRQLVRRSASTPYDLVDRHVRSLQSFPRDDIADQQQIAQAEATCENSPNSVISCWPMDNTTIPQHLWTRFVWNSRLPQYAQTNLVNIYLYHGDSQELVFSALNVSNPTNQAGSYPAQVNDSWFGTRGAAWNGVNISYPMYWIITSNENPSGQSPIPQSTFTAVQTTYADSILSYMSSTSAAAAAASSASAASVASASAASASSAAAVATRSAGAASGSTTLSSPLEISTTNVGPSSSAAAGSGSVQSATSSNFPHWAIAVIVVLGFLALVAGGVLAFFITRRMRGRRNSMLSHRGSMGSSTPMMSNAGNAPLSPVIGSAALGAGMNRPHTPADTHEVHDGASTMSRTSDTAPFSVADAAIMADAFRKALRKPDQMVEEGESPDEQNGHQHPGALLSQELAEEGRDIRSVGSSRAVRVETLSDGDNDAATVPDP